MIGGGGERKTLRMVAHYADESNLACAVEEIPRKLQVLAEHCKTVGRDPSEITVTYPTSVCIAPTREQAIAEYDAYTARQPENESRRAATIIGGPDEIAEHYATLLAIGIDGVTVNAPANGHIEGRVTLLGETLAPLLAR
jgi:alkanesulfonate monooxygenase SsuD/methylene tetrahydromethanopterin reductase-like flavin-dependent oxidoreductase (luciferase family)